MQNRKELVIKAEALSLVPGGSDTGESCSDERAAALRDSFEGWLNSVAPTLQPKALQMGPARVRSTRRPLTSMDIVRVNRATIRESSAPRAWPPDVVLSFLAADVIKRK
jgi:hypothetical protein